MELQLDKVMESQNLIKKLLTSIEAATESMNTTFEDAVIRHEEQFIKCYRIKIYELIKLFEQLKSTIQDKFINNTLAIQLQTILKERDYFKYECLKLNSQHQTLLDDHKNLAAQVNNATEQMTIYKHLLQTQKIRTNQMESNIQKHKKNLNQIVSKNLADTRVYNEHRVPEPDRQTTKIKRQMKQKNEIIRALRERIQDMDRAANFDHNNKVEKKDLYELFRVCVEGWKRELLIKGKRQEKKLTNYQQLSSTNKKQLLRILFTHNGFLTFLERLLFDDGFKVTIESTEQKYMEKNRLKLFTFMNQRRIYTSPNKIRI